MPKQFPQGASCPFIILAASTLTASAATSITGIATDFGGFFESYANGVESGLNANSNRPNDAHNLLGFYSEGTMYSTGVNDSALTANGVAFTPANYAAFVPNMAESRNAGQGSAEDGDDTGWVGQSGQVHATPAGTTNNRYDVTDYITDGINGLGMSTFANNVGGIFTFDLTNVDSSTLGDGVPDLFYFNMAAPSSNAIEYEFFDINGISLGSASSIENAHPDIAQVRNDRFRASNGTDTRAPSDQNVQGFSLEFSDFAGLTQSSLGSATTLRVTLPNQADPPFFAYNTDAFLAIDSSTSIPEPSSSVLILISGYIFLQRRKR